MGRRALILSILLAGACGDDGGGTHSLFELSRAVGAGPAAPGSDFYSLPYPNALRLDDDGTPALADYPRVDDFTTNYTNVIDANARGFGPTEAIYVRFDNAIDPSTLPDPAGTLLDGAGVFLVDVTPGSAHRGEKIPLKLRFEPNHFDFIGTNWLGMQPVPGIPPREGETYAAVVTDAIHGPTPADGPVRAPNALTRVLANQPDGAIETRAAQAYAPLAAWLDEQGLRQHVVAATVYTTGTGTTIMDELRAAVEALPVPTVRDLVHASSTSRYDLYTGVYDGPNFQEGDPPYFSSGGQLHRGPDGTFTPVRTEALRVAMTVPKGPMPAQGWPIILYAHGTGGDYESFVDDGTGDRFALVVDKAGNELARFAVISIDQVLHGTRVPPNTDNATAFFNFYNILAARDNVKQGALDDFQLLRLAKALDIAAAPDTGTPIRFDASRIYFFGHSQGSTTGGPFVAAEPEVKAAIFSGAGAGLVQGLLDKKKPVDIPGLVQSFFRDPIDPFHPFLNLLQGYFDDSDSANYNRRLFLEPPSGASPKNVLVTLGLRDSYAPPSTIEIFALAAGVVPINPMLMPIESLALTGRSFVDAPQVGNVAGGVTGVVAEYDPGPGDGHFVVFDVPAAEAQTTRFFGTHAQGGVARVDPP